MVEILQRHTGPVFSVLGLVGESTQLPSSVPYGGYWMQFIPPNQELPTPEMVEAHLIEQSKAMRLSDTQHPFLLQQSAEHWPLEQWGHSWLALGEGYASFGDEVSAQRCFTYGRQWLSSDVGIEIARKFCTRLKDEVVFDCVLQYTEWINL